MSLFRRQFGPEVVTVFASAARTATANSADQVNKVGRGVRLCLDVTNVSGTLSPTLDVKIQAKDPVSGVYKDITGASFAQKTAAGHDDLVIYPGIAETANRKVSNVLPKDWRAVATLGGTDPNITFSLSAEYLA